MISQVCGLLLLVLLYLSWLVWVWRHHRPPHAQDAATIRQVHRLKLIKRSMYGRGKCSD
jgi:4-amino-4-deoxy-L-arabinose transferase-like glycosyltransferase